MGTPRRRRDGFRLRLSTSNLPGTLFLLILIVCATALALSKGLASLRSIYAETNRPLLPFEMKDGRESRPLGDGFRGSDDRTPSENIARLVVTPESKEAQRMGNRSSDYILIPLGDDASHADPKVN